MSVRTTEPFVIITNGKAARSEGAGRKPIHHFGTPLF